MIPGKTKRGYEGQEQGRDGGGGEMTEDQKHIGFFQTLKDFFHKVEDALMGKSQKQDTLLKNGEGKFSGLLTLLDTVLEGVKAKGACSAEGEVEELAPVEKKEEEDADGKGGEKKADEKEPSPDGKGDGIKDVVKQEPPPAKQEEAVKDAVKEEPPTTVEDGDTPDKEDGEDADKVEDRKDGEQSSFLIVTVTTSTKSSSTPTSSSKPPVTTSTTSSSDAAGADTTTTSTTTSSSDAAGADKTTTSSSTNAADTTTTTTACPDECKSPFVADGDARRGGVKLEDGVCFAWASYPYSNYENKRFCGPEISSRNREGKDGYTKDGGYVVCIILC